LDNEKEARGEKAACHESCHEPLRLRKGDGLKVEVRAGSRYDHSSLGIELVQLNNIRQ
jgi:hypothetical protein